MTKGLFWIIRRGSFFCVILRVCEFFVDGDRFAGRELDDGGEAEVR
jgi:hypothetical protein